ncbi:beta-1,4-galactosyltransferase 2-like isoform X1 [Clavelina lepadiformis]|uniref:beta-1,4-galactosyltransferase 2-like isoform X1 n=1 Tax=Clavelina lepadiformis TaxID=159417 RepID=UPI0040426C46
MTKFQRTLLVSAAAVLVVYTIQSFIGIRFYYKSWCMCPQVQSPPKNDYFRYIQTRTERPFGAQASNTKNTIRTTSEFLIERVTSDLSVDSRLTTAAATVIDENTTAKPISTAKTVNYCPEVSPLLQGNVVVPRHKNIFEGNLDPLSFEEISAKNPNVQFGGYYPGPANCTATNSVAVVIPYRDREVHLRYLLTYIHLILQRQQIKYRVFVVEQDDNLTFNKGQVMNSAFKYIKGKYGKEFDCYFFHDVDTIGEDDRITYRCKGGREVVHLSHKIERLHYRFCCGLTIGGVLGLTSSQLEAVNGFPNAYHGWGGEDDDMNNRILEIANFTIYRPPEDYVRFRTLFHEVDDQNPKNPERFKLLKGWKDRAATDGLNSLQTIITRVAECLTHTHIYIKPISYVSGQTS